MDCNHHKRDRLYTYDDGQTVLMRQIKLGIFLTCIQILLHEANQIENRINGINNPYFKSFFIRHKQQ